MKLLILTIFGLFFMVSYSESSFKTVNPSLPPTVEYDSICLILPDFIENYSQFNDSYYQDSLTTVMDNIPSLAFITNEGATLGRVLFYDKRLSINDSISCSSCHQQNLGFTDNKRFSIGHEGSAFTSAHSMRLGNSRFFEPASYFWDRRALSLEEQVVMPIKDSIEMGFSIENGGIDSLRNKLKNISYYNNLFTEAYGDSQITTERLQNALSQFIRSMVANNSKWDFGFNMVYDSTLSDHGMNLDFPNFSEHENEGKQLFMNLEEDEGAGCVRCHLPPSFGLSKESKSIGLDLGETVVFKSPSLRNVTLSNHFMHDGRFTTLDETIVHYAQQIKLGPSLDTVLIQPNGSPEKLALNKDKREKIIAFLKTLEDTELINHERWSNPFFQCIEDCKSGKGLFGIFDSVQVLHQTSSRIPSHSEIINNSKIIFKSDDITLKEGFFVEKGSIFQADIDPCIE